MKVSKEIEDQILGFLEEIGIEVIETELNDDDCFLPGLHLKHGNILMDRSRLKYPGDLLHEAGHIAVTPAEDRPKIGTDEMDPEWPPMGDEIVTILWSFAAVNHIGIPLEVVFHEDGYRDHSEWFMDLMGSGNYPGLPLLEWMGLTNSPEKAAEENTEAFPKMIKWVR